MDVHADTLIPNPKGSPHSVIPSPCQRWDCNVPWEGSIFFPFFKKLIMIDVDISLYQ